MKNPARRISPSDTNKFVVMVDPLVDNTPFISVVEIFEVGGKTPPNAHQDAHEMFYVLSGRGRAYCDGKVVADHARAWAKHQSFTLPEHDAAAKQLRRERIGLVRPAPEPEVEIRCLDDYDTALGLDDADGTVA